MFEIKGKYTNAKIMIDNVEESCVGQITKMTNHPGFSNPISIMPDTHAGKGSVIGFTMPITDKIIPNVIGMDIGCGMLAINIGQDFPMEKAEFDSKVREAVPFGFLTHNTPVINMKKDFPWKEVKETGHNFSLAFNEKFGTNTYFSDYSMKWFEDKCDTIGAKLGRIINSIGSLGGGNHFVEVGEDGNGDNWVVIHTGSRNFGKCVCEYWQKQASKVIKDKNNKDFRNKIIEIRNKYKGKEITEKIKEARKELGLDEFNYNSLPDELQWLNGDASYGYLYDMIFAQKYAEVNRDYIAKAIMKVLGVKEIDRIETIHNFIDFRDFIIRKGAIRSYVGEKMIIPFNMRDGILICEGKSNKEWNCSAPHGAGRVLSRSKAKKLLNIEDFEKQMVGIYSTSVVSSTLDEAPDAYKEASVIEKAIEPTAKILLKIKPILNMKDNGNKKRVW